MTWLFVVLGLIPLLGMAAAWQVGPLAKLRTFLQEKEARAQTREQELGKMKEEVRELYLRFSRQEKEIEGALEKYGTIKSLAQAVSWEAMVGPIERLMLVRLNLEEFVLFLMNSHKNLEPVLRHRLWSLKTQDVDSRQPPPLKPELVKVTVGGAALPNLFLRIPIFQGEELLAEVWAKPPKSGFANQQELLYEAQEVAGELTFGLSKARLFRSLETLSRLDGLTGLHRRHVFQERLTSEVKRSMAFKTTFCLMMIDIDHFKMVNDSYGHQAGDDVLAGVAAILKESVYETDFAARYGGEEFALILPNADTEGVKRKAESLRRQVEAKDFSIGWQQITVTISLGLAHFPRDGATAEAVVSAADQALYASKGQGRNRWTDYADLS